MSALIAVKNFICDMNAAYEEFTAKWNDEYKGVKINLRKKTIKEVGGVDGPLYGDVVSYLSFLNENSPLITVCLLQHGEFVFRVSCRVKARNSVVYKMDHYTNTKEHEFGNVSVNKCLNDLFGARLILDDNITFEELNALVNDLGIKNIRCMDSSKGDYLASHIYFRKDNKNFPWELQIWTKQNELNNLESHKMYKQGYTKWEEESKKGGFIRD